MSLLGGGGPAGAQEEAANDVSIPPADEWTQSQKLQAEKEVLGFYLTSHPLTDFAGEIESFAQQTVADLRNMTDGGDVLIGGMVSSIKKAVTKNPSRNGNSKYINFDLEDPKGVVRCIMWPDDFATQGEKIEPEAIIIVKGRIDSRGREPNVICNKVMTLSDAEKEFTKQIFIKFIRGQNTEDEMKRIRDVLSRFPGKTPVAIVVETWQEIPSVIPSTSSNGNGHTTNGAAALSEGTSEEGELDGDEIEELEPLGAMTPASSNRLRAILTTNFQVAARPELKEALRDILGSGGFKFVADVR